MTNDEVPAATLERVRLSEPTVAEEMLDEVDLARLRELDPAKQKVARRRLAVIKAYVGDDRDLLFDGLAMAARVAEVSRTTMFTLLAAWRRDEPFPLTALGLYLGKRPPSDPERETRVAAISREAEGMLRAEPDLRTSDLVRLLSAGTGAGVAPATILKIVDEVRPTLPSREPFGALLRLDAASLDLADDAGRRQRLYAVVDSGTGIVSGWKVSPEGEFAKGYADAAEMACGPDAAWTRPIGRFGLLTARGPARVEVSLPSGADAGLRALADAAGWRVAADPRRVGRGLIAAVGRSLGSMPLSAGFAPAGVSHRSRLPKALDLAGPLSLQRVDRALIEHDAARVRLTKAGSKDYERVLRQALDPILREREPRSG